MTSTIPEPRRLTARSIAAAAVAHAAAHFPDIAAPQLSLDALDDRDRRLCLAIYRTTMQRWKTLEYLLDLKLRKPCRKLDPMVQGVLFTAAAQILFMERMPAHAVVNEAVKLTRRQGFSAATGLVNAVLRRVDDMVGEVVTDEAWQPSENTLPLGTGFLQLKGARLPRVDNLPLHMSVAASVPLALLTAWQKEHGPARMQQLALHAGALPPIIVAIEPNGEWSDDWAQQVEPHTTSGFVVWRGEMSNLTEFLAQHPARRVQDPAAALAVDSTADLQPRLIVDYCAGRGTKTRQLAVTHPHARIIASDPDANRFADLQQLAAEFDHVTAAPLADLHATLAGARADLLVLDVPCSNTGVLARRPEARYRYQPTMLRSLVDLQRSIMQESLPILRPGGHVLYATCSIDRQENQQQTAWLISRKSGATIHESTTLPSGTDTSYHDGGYAALVRVND